MAAKVCALRCDQQVAPKGEWSTYELRDIVVPPVI